MSEVNSTYNAEMSPKSLNNVANTAVTEDQDF